MSNQVIENKNYTLSYDSGVKGFPSFYSYDPEWMLGMNNFFYTFKGGNLYRHIVNESRNEYYGTRYPSVVQSVFNENPLDNKLFKTINLEGDDSWDTLIFSDQQNTGFIEGGQLTADNYYETKEGAQFAFIRNSGQSFTSSANSNQFPLRSLNGIATSNDIVIGGGNTTTVNFPTSIFIGGIISIGDMLYFTDNGVPKLIGRVTSIDVDLPAGINRIVTQNNIPTSQTPGPSEYILYLKNSVAESHGILGHYAVFTLTNYNANKTELFAVESEVMKSYP
jgi:hypothetical protein